MKNQLYEISERKNKLWKIKHKLQISSFIKTVFFLKKKEAFLKFKLDSQLSFLFIYLYSLKL